MSPDSPAELFSLHIRLSFSMFPSCCIGRCDRPDSFGHDLDVRAADRCVCDHVSCIKGNTGHFVPLQQYFPPPLLCCSSLTTRAVAHAHPVPEHLRYFPVLLQDVYWWEGWLQQLPPGCSRRSFVIISASFLFNAAPSFHLSWQFSRRTPVKCGSERSGSCWNSTGRVSALVLWSQW